MANIDLEKKKNLAEKEDVEKIVNRYLDWLDSEISIQWAYHNHKETTAWVATAAYITPILFLFRKELVLNACEKGVITIGFVALLYAIYVFVNMQFQMRWEAADRSRGLRRARAMLCGITTPNDLKKINLVLNKDEDRDSGNKTIEYPEFIRDEIREATTKPKKLTKVWELFWSSDIKNVPKTEFKDCRPRPLMWPSTLENINARTRSEFASYSALVIVTLTFFLVKVWFV